MAGPYIYGGITNNFLGTCAILVWDISNDTQHSLILSSATGGGNPNTLYLSSDQTTLVRRGTCPTGIGVQVVSTSALTGFNVPNGLQDQELNPYFCHAVSPDGSVYYVADSVTNKVRAVNSTTGAIIRTSATTISSAQITGCSVSRDGSILFIGSPIVAFNTFDLSVKYTTAVISQAGVQGYSADGTTACYINNAGTAFTTFTVATGATIGSVSIANLNGHLVVSPDGTTAYVWTNDAGTYHLRSVDIATLTPTLLWTFTTIPGDRPIAITGDGANLYFVKPSTGSQTTFFKKVIATGVETTLTPSFGGFGTAVDVLLGISVSAPIAGPSPPALSTLGLCEGPQVSLSWTTPTGSPTSYNLYVNGMLAMSGIAGNAYVYSPVTIGLPYSFQVTAVNSGGESAKSNTVVVTPCIANNAGTPCPCVWTSIEQPAGPCTWTATELPTVATWTQIETPCIGH